MVDAEKAGARIVHPSEGTKSALANRLLHLWASGLLSAVSIRELAHLAMLDGAQHPELAAIASSGAWGQHPGNCHRDIQSHFISDLDLCAPFSVSVPCVDPKTEARVYEDIGIYLPHLLFSSMQGYDDFGTFFAVDECADFWRKVEAVGDPRLNGHPMQANPSWRQKTVPLFLHGDGVEYSNDDSLLVFHGGMCYRAGARWTPLCFSAHFRRVPQSARLQQRQALGMRP